MRSVLAILFTTTILTASSCNVLNNKEKEAIEICQKGKAQFLTEDIFTNIFLNIVGLNEDATWLDFANALAQEEPNKKYDWSAVGTDEKGVYIVSFADEKGWGHRWEVTIDQQIVKHINSNEYLVRKYGLSRMSDSEDFKITHIQTDTLLLTGGTPQEIVYKFKGTVVNNTDKTIIDADIEGELKLIFEEKTVSGGSGYQNGFRSEVSKSQPWRSGEDRDFNLRTDGIETIYADYTPPYVLFEIALTAEDPVGYEFDENLEEYDLADKWAGLRLQE
jgi:hypothetical protein